jgi:small-conductance mechanosensitive channel
MDYYTPPIYSFSVLLFLFLALFIFTGFRLFKYLLRFLRLSRDKVLIIDKYLPVSEMIVWGLFFIWAIQFLYNKGYLLALMPAIVLIIILLYLSWFGLKDIIAGLVFKTSNQLQINDHITITEPDIAGKIISIRRTFLELEDESGRVILIPFSKIAGTIIFKNSPSHSLLSHSFKLKVVSSDTESDSSVLAEKIKAFILVLPWTSQKKLPKISIDEDSDGIIVFSLTIYTPDEVYFAQTEKQLAKEFAGKIIPVEF